MICKGKENKSTLNYKQTSKSLMMGCINVELCIMLSTVSEILTVASYWVNIQIIIGIGWV